MTGICLATKGIIEQRPCPIATKGIMCLTPLVVAGLWLGIVNSGLYTAQSTTRQLFGIDTSIISRRTK